MTTETAETKALALMANLTSGVSFDIPEVDLSGEVFSVPGGTEVELYSPVDRISIESITDGTATGEGVFDTIMQSCSSHLRVEYEAGRITGDQYAKVYMSMMEAAMANATQFVLTREQAYWDAQKSQIAAITGRAELEKAKLSVALTKIQATTAKAEYAKSVMSLALAGTEFDKAEFELTFVVPEQLNKLKAETVLLGNQNLKIIAETALTDKQVEKVDADIAQTNTQIDLLNAQKLNVEAQTLNEPKKGSLLDEQVEATRAQTLDFRTDGALVTGQIGKQKELYSQQITSYKRDAEIKAGKMFADAWMTQKTIDEGLLAPSGFTNASLDQVLTKIKTELEMVP